MPLHEYLERKRLENIDQLNADGACHICGSNCRNSAGFTEHVLGNHISGIDGPHYCNANSMVKPPNMAAMRTCSCFGIPETDPNYCPSSLRVCDRCIEDDKGIGRIRICGVCGTVACDEYCGPVLVECTDSPEWNNAGCIECRRMGDFSELDIFKRSNNEKKDTRMTRICIKCLKQSNPWVTQDFVCRRFHCETRLVPSDIVERKRYTTFGSSPLNLLPEDGLVTLVDFLSGSDLKNLFFTCSAMCTVAERVAMEKVMNMSDTIPTGPIVSENKALANGKSEEVMRLEGSNSFGLRAPDDVKAWVGLYHYLEKLTKEMFHFSFLMEKGEVGRDVVGRFICQSRGEKFTFGKTFNGTVRDKLIELGDDDDELFVRWDDGLSVRWDDGLSVRGGTVLVRRGMISMIAPNVVFASSKCLDAGIHRVICRLYSPGIAQDPPSLPRPLHRNQSSKLGAIGIVSISNPMSDEPTIKLSKFEELSKPRKTDEVVFGMTVEYNDKLCKLSMFISTGESGYYTNNHVIKRTSDDHHYIAVELTSTILQEEHSVLGCRYCDEEEWDLFINHAERPFLAVEALQEHLLEMREHIFHVQEDIIEEF